MSLLITKGVREKWHIPQHPVRPWGHFSESLLPQAHFNPFVNTVYFDMFTGSRVECVLACRCMWAYSWSHMGSCYQLMAMYH